MSACRHPASHYHSCTMYHPHTIPLPLPSMTTYHSYTNHIPLTYHPIHILHPHQAVSTLFTSADDYNARDRWQKKSWRADLSVAIEQTTRGVFIHLDRGAFNKVVRVGRLQHDLASSILSAAVALPIINELNEGNAFVRSRLLVTLSLSSPQRHSRRPFSSTSRSLCSATATRNVSVSWVHEHESRGNTVDTPHASDRFTDD